MKWKIKMGIPFLLLSITLPPLVDAGSVKKSYINLSKEGNQAQATDLPSSYNQVTPSLAAIEPDIGSKGYSIVKTGTLYPPVAGKFGKALDVKSYNPVSYMYTTNNYEHIFQNHSFTVEGWIYFRTDDAFDAPCCADQRLMIGGPGGYDKGLHIMRRNNHAYFAFYADDLVASKTNMVKGQWWHMAVTWDAATKKRFIYLNGEIEAQDTSTGALNVPDGYNVYIGRNMDGYIDDVRLWDHARTQQEVKDNMNHELNGNEKGLVSYWKMN